MGVMNAREKYEQGLVQNALIVDWKTIYEQLPSSFSIDDIVNMSPTMKKDSIRKQCSRWTNNGKVTRTAPGKYLKTA